MIYLLLLLTISKTPCTEVGAETTNSLGYEVINQFLKEIEGKKSNKKYKLVLALLKYEKVFWLENLDFTTPEFFELNWVPSPNFDIDTLLTEHDFSCLKSQSQLYNKERLERERLVIKQRHILVRDKLTEQQAVTPEFNKYNLAWPLFSCDKEIAFLYVEEFCGIEYGSGTLYIYQLVTGQSWSKVGSITMYIS